MRMAVSNPRMRNQRGAPSALIELGGNPPFSTRKNFGIYIYLEYIYI
jgi:hypothetical protein